MNKLRTFLSPKFLVSGLILAATLAFGYNVLTNQHAQAAVDCDDNAVIRCGYTDLNNLVTKYNQNPYGDLDNIYGHWGVQNINTFKANAKHVTVYKNGQVKLDDGTIVATGAQSMGRKATSGNRHSMSIDGKTYYYSSTQDSFNPNSLDGYASFNPDDNSMQLAILKACGNPVWGNTSAYKCKMLQQEKVNDTTYNFSVQTYQKNATVTKIVIDFGDGQSKTITSNFGQKVSHTYQPGDYTAKATVYFSVNGKEKSDTRVDCTKKVSVAKPKPVYACTSLMAKRVTGSRTKFTFTATASVANGAALQNGVFKFSDGKTSGPVNAVGNTVTTTYDFAKEGEYTTTVDLTFNAGKDVNNPKCKVTVKVVPPTCEETPEKPECKQPCELNPELPECKPPEQPKKDCVTNPEMAECKVEEIPSTGPAEIIGAALGVGTITGAGMYYRNTRRNLLDTILKR